MEDHAVWQLTGMPLINSVSTAVVVVFVVVVVVKAYRQKLN